MAVVWGYRSNPSKITVLDIRWIGFLNVAKADSNVIVRDVCSKDDFGNNYIVIFLLGFEDEANNR
jgi:hypothetical protein